jgi:hypothetical protein
MKSFIGSLSIMALCLFSLCLGQTVIYDLNQLDLEVGTTHTFEFHDNDVYIGYNQYTVTKREFYNETDAYFIESTLDLKSDLAVIHMDASYVIDTFGRCLHYEFEATVNGESHVVSADFTADSVHIIASRPGEKYDKTITLAENTQLLDNNMIGQWDLVFSTAILEEGGTYGTNILAAQSMRKGSIKASIAEELVSVQVAGKTWQCFKLEFSSPLGYTAYVTRDGQLIKMENESGIVITLKE